MFITKLFLVKYTIYIVIINDVVAVTKSGYDACSSNDQRASPVNDGPANIPLSSAGKHYYICSFSGHCSAGQKLAINVESKPSDSGDAPSPVSGAPPPPSSSAFVLVAQSYFMASGVILSMAHGLLNF
ncbi:Cupredoxins domain-containing protein [Dioscorea alata]|uniref:Cupredoxins domain-containing protein n=1 Tax=Dioscorea alata TaxID=55571 RepID=A0ACB7W2M4_DIOAL|nr:Cupredoxins domain-containing protein [Dioscorea alata]